MKQWSIASIGVSYKGFRAESRVFLVLPKKVFSIRRRRVHHPEELEKTPIKRAPWGGSKYYRLSASIEGSAKHRHQSQRVRTLSRGLEAASESTPRT